jgi:hypothetical protein
MPSTTDVHTATPNHDNSVHQVWGHHNYVILKDIFWFVSEGQISLPDALDLVSSAPSWEKIRVSLPVSLRCVASLCNRVAAFISVNEQRPLMSRVMF